MIWPILLLFSIILTTHARKEHQCPPGYYIKTPKTGPEICLPCKDGVSFVPESTWHSRRKCEECSRIRDPVLEVIVEPCTRTSDTVILCVEGYYRRKHQLLPENDRCIPCSVCEHVTLNCHGYHDHVCCDPSQDAHLTEYGVYVCKKRPVQCGPGEFVSRQTEQCTICLPGTFMTLARHNKTACDVCENLTDQRPGQMIVQPCDKTHATIFGCKAGYFRNISHETVAGELQCVPCSQCQHQIRACGQTTDSVCCDEPDMEVTDTDWGPVCSSTSPNSPNNPSQSTGSTSTGQPSTPIRKVQTEIENKKNLTESTDCEIFNMQALLTGTETVTCQPCQQTQEEDIARPENCVEILVNRSIVAKITPKTLMATGCLVLVILSSICTCIILLPIAWCVYRSIKSRRKRRKKEDSNSEESGTLLLREEARRGRRRFPESIRYQTV